MTNAERCRARYDERKARGSCVDCDADANGFVRCEDCRERGRIHRSQYNKRKPEVSRERMKRLYWQDPEKFRAKNRERRLEKKLRGECEKCPLPANDGSAFCEKHTELERVRKREYRARFAAGGPRKKGGAPLGVTRTDAAVMPCACGATKAPDAACCNQCARLDGLDISGSPGRVIDVLRDDSGDGLSLRDLCVALGMNADVGNGQRQMWRWVQPLLDSGRVRRYWRENLVESVEIESFRNGVTQFERGTGCWAYQLNWSAARAA